MLIVNEKRPPNIYLGTYAGICGIRISLQADARFLQGCASLKLVQQTACLVLVVR
jgi:hypothetical protein